MKITYVMNQDGDWEAIYVDGKLAAQGHSLEVWDVLDALGVKYTSYHNVEVDGYLPQSEPDWHVLPDKVVFLDK